MIAGIGLLIQTGKFTDNFTQASTAFVTTLLVAFIVFYIVAVTICFYAYREFKGMLYDNGMGGSGMAGGLGGMMAGRQPSNAAY